MEAICLTRNKTSAFNCLKKLVDNDLRKGSHEWEALGTKWKVMTMRERIDEVRERIEKFEKAGWSFE